MSKCLYCHQRKGKRACPALEGMICSQCCGTHRISDISCPTSCIFLETNDDYQQKRVGSRFELERRGFYRQMLDLGGERATEIFYVFEALAYRFFQDRRDAQDAEVLEGLQSLRRSFSVIHIPDSGLPAFGEELRKEFKVFGERQPLEPIWSPRCWTRPTPSFKNFPDQGFAPIDFCMAYSAISENAIPMWPNNWPAKPGRGGALLFPVDLITHPNTLHPKKSADLRLSIHIPDNLSVRARA